MKKKHIRNLSLMCVVLTICLALIGTAFGHWASTLKITGTTIVENMAIEVVNQLTNDPMNHDNDDGIWVDGVYTGVLGNDETIEDGFVSGSEDWTGKDVGRTDCFLVDTDGDSFDDTVDFYIYNAYPCYFAKLGIWVENKGDLDVQVDRVDIIFPDDGLTFIYLPLDDEGKPVEGATKSPPWPTNKGMLNPDGEFEVKWTNGIGNLPIGLDAGTETQFGCMVHILQPASQNAVYHFQVKFYISGPV